MGNFDYHKKKQQPISISAKNFKQLLFGIVSKNSKQKKVTAQELQEKFKDKNISRSFGCLFGCFIGDALGAYCQFQTSALQPSFLKETMQMNGGGVFKLHKGQFTDDSQMAYHLFRALSQFNVEQPFNQQKEIVIANIMKQYLNWNESAPFDQGITCRKGILIIQTYKEKLQERDKIKANVQYILSEVKKVNDKSQSNGSLMRIAPLAIFFSFIRQDPINYQDFIKAQISAIHPNELLQSAGYVWVKVLYDLILRKDDNKQTYAKIYQDAKALPQSKIIFQWFKQAQESQKMPATDNMGWAKIAWTYGMKIIYRMGRQITKIQTAKIPNYVVEIEEVIKEAGDSDTNAAIVSGLIGAIIGFQNLHLKYLENIFNLSFPQQNVTPIDRPKHYEPLNIFFQLLSFQQKCEQYKSKFHKQNPNQLKGKL